MGQNWGWQHRVIEVPEEGEQEAEELFEEITMENFPNLVKKIDIQPQEAQRVPPKNEPKGAHTKTHHNSNAKG